MKKRKGLIFAAILAFLAVAAMAVYVLYISPNYIVPAETYNEAKKLYDSGNYMKAALKLDSIKGYGDSAKLAKNAWKLAGDVAYNEGKIDVASACYDKGSAGEADIKRLDELYLSLAENAFMSGEISRGEISLNSIKNKDAYIDRIDALRISSIKNMLNGAANADDIRASAARYKLCSEGAYGTIIADLMERGAAQLSNRSIELAQIYFHNVKDFVDDGNITSVMEWIKSEYRKAAEAADARGDRIFAAKCKAMIEE